MRIHVHLEDIRFVSTCDRSSTIGELRRAIETQYASLHPRAPPLAAHALQNADGYLLPSTLLVGDAVADGDKISVVLETELPPVAQTEVTQVLSRWRYFQRYTLLAIEASLQQSGGLSEDPMLVLFEMLAAKDPALVRKACLTLRAATQMKQTTIPSLDGTPCAKILCSLGRTSQDPTIQQACAAIITACVQDPLAVAALQAAGAANTLSHLSRSDCQMTRALATAGLWEISHAMSGKHRKRASPGALSQQDSESKHGIAANEIPRSALESLEMLESAATPAVAQMALEALERECGEASFHDLALLEATRVVRALDRAITHFDEPMVHANVSDLLCKCVEQHDTEAQIVFAYGGFKMLVQLVEEAEVARDVAEETKSTPARLSLGASSESTAAHAALEVVCLSSQHVCPAELLVEALTASSSAAVRQTVSDALSRRAQDDEHNDLRAFIPSIMSAASQASPGTDESAHLTKSIAALSIKEANKLQLIRYGAARNLCQLLACDAREAGITTHRTAAKGLANIASSTKENRASVLQAMQSLMPPVASFTDSIVAMYLQMIFS